MGCGGEQDEGRLWCVDTTTGQRQAKKREDPSFITVNALIGKLGRLVDHTKVTKMQVSSMHTAQVKTRGAFASRRVIACLPE